MRCLECGADFDEMNESQPVCPGCGAVPGNLRDGVDVYALLDDAAVMIGTAQSDRNGSQDNDFDTERLFEPMNLPPDLQEADDDAQALLEAIGYAIFVLSDGTRFFSLPPHRLM